MPNDATLQLSEGEAFQVSLAVDLALGNAGWAHATKHAHGMIGNVRLSELSKHVPTLRQVSRRLGFLCELAGQNERLAELEMRVEALEKHLFSA
jgi:hypothetical protein